MSQTTEVIISVENKDGIRQKSCIGIKKSPIMEPEIGYLTDEEGNSSFKCVEGLYEFTAHSQQDESSGKVQVDVQGKTLIRVNIVLK